MYLSDAERDYQRQVEKDLPRNFAVHLVHGLLGQTGFRLVNTSTFVPAYILLLQGGAVLLLWVREPRTFTARAEGSFLDG